jgi:hypothetical protein
LAGWQSVVGSEKPGRDVEADGSYVLGLDLTHQALGVALDLVF